MKRDFGRVFEKHSRGYMMHFKHYKEAPIVIVEAHNLDFVKYRSDYEKLKKLLNDDYDKGITRIIF